MAEIVIFDMDGTLIDTGRATAPAFRRIAERYGLPILDDDSVIRAIGLPCEEYYRHLYPDVDAEIIDRFGEDVEREEAQVLSDQGGAAAFDGVEEMLDALIGRGKILHLASTGSHRHVNSVMASTGLGRFFRSIRCGEPMKVRMVADILSQHAGQSAAFVGDTMKDVQAARANHISVIGAGFGYCYPDRHELFDHVAASPQDLVTLLD